MAGWSGYGDKKGGANQGFVVEGKVPIFSFSETETKVRFLTESVEVEDLMSKNGWAREQAEDFVNTKLIHEKWIMPVTRWEHSIKEIPGKRFFTTVVCRGRQACELCAENEAAKENGVTENKLLPYGVRKRFYVPAWFYDLKRVLFVRGAEDFFDDIASYIGKNGPDSDFGIWKVGRGFNTKYKSVFLGVGAPMDVDWSAIPAPKDLDFSLDEEEWRRRIDGGPGARTARPDAAPAAQAAREPVQPRADAAAVPPSSPEIPKHGAVDVAVRPAGPESTADFVVPFGSHKGKTFKQLFDLGETDYIKFLADQGAGLVKQKATDYLAGK
jgi:hypothetical protein